MRELPLLVGVTGFGRMVGAKPASVRAWRSRLDYDMPIRPGMGFMLREHAADGTRPLWFTDDVVGWAMRNGLITVYPSLPTPRRRPVMTVPGIAAKCGVTAQTVRNNWRRAPGPDGVAPPVSMQVLPQPDLVVETVAVWFTETIDEWGLAVGRFITRP